jgi:hypothetical protein
LLLTIFNAFLDGYSTGKRYYTTTGQCVEFFPGSETRLTEPVTLLLMACVTDLERVGQVMET